MSARSVPSRWFVRGPSTEHASRLFCFPYSGTGASAFSSWPAALAQVEVCPLQFPGRENRLGEPHYGTYENLVADLVKALRQRLDRPFAFFGHCAGAVVAYETALRLADLGLPTPACLFVSGQAAPHEVPRDRMLDMTDDELRAELAQFVRGRGIEPRPDMIEVGLSVLLGDLAAARAYRRDRPVAVRSPVVVLHWRDDPEVTLDELQSWHQYSDAVDIRIVDGGHHDFTHAPDELRSLLTRWR
ncbi:putative thioesterase [Frankia alni ACN14a]|uniref:Thioesterase n=1 Tax=Frankia alni (strain DSM 45986 / CECT 9034 / ACN14a) TaxID=326424 RepID=Q0RMP1_FRAAA|nr:putative thioesterase [Frankia alni ACN14a]